MFEKDSEEYVNKDTWLYETAREDAKYHFQQGAEYGYNKANEWRYMKDGLPEMSTESVYCSDDLIFLTKDCSGNIKSISGISILGKDLKNIIQGMNLYQIKLPLGKK